MLIEKKKINFLDMMIDLVFITFFILHYLLPSFGHGMNFIIPLFLAVAYACYLGVKDFRLGATLILFLGAILFLTTMYTVLTDTKTIVSTAGGLEFKQFMSKFNQYALMFFPALLLYRVLKIGNRRYKTVLLLALAAIIAFVMVQTFIEVIKNPGALRHWEDFEDLASENVGTYTFVYGIPILITALFACLKSFKLIGKLLGIAAIITMFVFLLHAEYTLALIISFLGLICVGYSSCRLKSTKILYVLFFVILFFFLLPPILKFAYSNIESKQVSLRLKELYDFFVSGDSSGYNLNGRLTLYIDTLKAFLKSPLFGNSQLDFDGHATFITVLSDTGLLGAVPMYGLVFATQRVVKKMLGESNRYFMPVFIGYILMGITNPIHSALPLAFAVWFIAPLTVEFFFNKENEKNEECLEN